MKKFLLMSAIISSGHLFGMENDPEVVGLSLILSQSPAAHKKMESFIKKLESNEEVLKVLKQSDAELNMQFGAIINKFKSAFSKTILGAKNDNTLSKEEEGNLLLTLDVLNSAIDSIINEATDKQH